MIRLINNFFSKRDKCTIHSVSKFGGVVSGQVYKHHNTYNGVMYVGVRKVVDGKIHFSDMENSKLLDLVMIWDIGLFLRMYTKKDDLYLNSFC